jgi:ATP-dependent helicase HrpB
MPCRPAAQGKPSDVGRVMAQIGVHPRFASMVLRGADPPLNAPELSALLASLLSERDILRGRQEAVRTASLTLRAAVLVSAL